MSGADETVNIEHLLVEAMKNDMQLPEDPLPSAEEIAGAKAAAAAAAHSTCSAAVGSSPAVRGLGGAGLNLKRKGGSKAGNASTISAATAPPALTGGPRAAAPSRAAAAAGNASASKLGSNAATPSRAAPAAAAAAAAAENAAAGVGGARAAGGQPDATLTGLATPDSSSRVLSKDAGGVCSFRTVVSPGTDDDNDEGSEWESASQGEVSAVYAQGWSCLGRLVSGSGYDKRLEC